MLERTLSRRERAAGVLDSPRLRGLLQSLPGWRGVLVLNYHRVGDYAGSRWDRSLWSASEQLLDGQLAVLAGEAEVIGPADVEAALGDGSRGRRVLITFDDGYRDNYEIAYPLLRRHGLSATFFLATGFIDCPRVAWWDEIAWMVRSARVELLAGGDWLARPLSLNAAACDASIGELTARCKTLPGERTEAFLDYLADATQSGRCDEQEGRHMWMTWDMAKEMERNGMTIGGHTVNHPVLSRLPLESQKAEIADCALRLEQELGKPMHWFAYPVGSPDSFTADTELILRERGVKLAFSFYGGLARFKRWSSLNIPRTDIGQAHSPGVLRTMLWFPSRFAR
jgi:peptidoglycan/xylan/chitin deacetylase (PgdA/CDA1 family)